MLLQVRNEHTTVNPSSVGEASLLGSGLVGVGDRAWRETLRSTGKVQFSGEIKGTNPPVKSFTFPRGGEVTLEQDGKSFTLTWEGQVDGKNATMKIEFGKGMEPKLTPEQEAKLPAKP